MNILAIETSCDETAIALVEAKGGLLNPKFYILNSLVASQIAVHRPFGGVVPNLAKREHLKNLPILFNKILDSKFYILNSIDIIAVTVAPGLEPALWTGINFAKEIHKKLQTANRKLRTKIIGASHLEGHLYSFLLQQKRVNSKFQIPNSKKLFPAISLVASGGHTTLFLMRDLVRVKKLGETLDDAAGEAFDKTARLLGLPYPGGPEIAKIAAAGNPDAVIFPRPMLNQKNYNFSFSGLKTAVLYYLRDHPETGKNTEAKADVAASFQKAAVDVLVAKTIRAAKEFKAKTVTLSGGVAANKALRDALRKAVKKELTDCRFIVPSFKYCTDNAAMIAVAAYVGFLRGRKRRLVASSTA